MSELREVLYIQEECLLIHFDLSDRVTAARAEEEYEKAARESIARFPTVEQSAVRHTSNPNILPDALLTVNHIRLSASISPPSG